MKTKRIALCAVLTAMALGLSYMERFLPLQLVVPLPGVKLGLANIVTLLALYFLGGRTAVTVLVLRCFLGSVFGGGVTALAFSLMGGLLALVTMLAARRLRFLSVYGVSILGAAAHNVGQIFAAMAVLKSVTVASYLPFLLFVSIATGMITGAADSASFRALLAAGQRSVLPVQIPHFHKTPEV